jgi:hypothetical protein
VGCVHGVSYLVYFLLNNTYFSREIGAAVLVGLVLLCIFVPLSRSRYRVSQWQKQAKLRQSNALARKGSVAAKAKDDRFDDISSVLDMPYDKPYHPNSSKYSVGIDDEQLTLGSYEAPEPSYVPSHRKDLDNFEDAHQVSRSIIQSYSLLPDPSITGNKSTTAQLDDQSLFDALSGIFQDPKSIKSNLKEEHQQYAEELDEFNSKLATHGVAFSSMGLAIPPELSVAPASRKSEFAPIFTQEDDTIQGYRAASVHESDDDDYDEDGNEYSMTSKFPILSSIRELSYRKQLSTVSSVDSIETDKKNSLNNNLPFTMAPKVNTIYLSSDRSIGFPPNDNSSIGLDQESYNSLDESLNDFTEIESTYRRRSLDLTKRIKHSYEQISRSFHQTMPFALSQKQSQYTRNGSKESTSVANSHIPSSIGVSSSTVYEKISRNGEVEDAPAVSSSSRQTASAQSRYGSVHSGGRFKEFSGKRLVKSNPHGYHSTTGRGGRKTYSSARARIIADLRAEHRGPGAEAVKEQAEIQLRRKRLDELLSMMPDQHFTMTLACHYFPNRMSVESIDTLGDRNSLVNTGPGRRLVDNES